MTRPRAPAAGRCAFQCRTPRSTPQTRSHSPMLESLRNMSPQTRARLGWAVAPTLASLAILLQWIIDVPKAEMLEREPPSVVGDADDNDSSDADPTPDKRRAKPKPKPKSKSN